MGLAANVVQVAGVGAGFDGVDHADGFAVTVVVQEAVAFGLQMRLQSLQHEFRALSMAVVGLGQVLGLEGQTMRQQGDTQGRLVGRQGLALVPFAGSFPMQPASCMAISHGLV